jgi:hypothetical protein
MKYCIIEKERKSYERCNGKYENRKLMSDHIKTMMQVRFRHKGLEEVVGRCCEQDQNIFKPRSPSFGEKKSLT